MSTTTNLNLSQMNSAKSVKLMAILAESKRLAIEATAGDQTARR